MDVIQKQTEHYSLWTPIKKAVAWILKAKDELLRLAKKRPEHGADMGQYDTGKPQQIQQLCKVKKGYKKKPK